MNRPLFAVLATFLMVVAASAQDWAKARLDQSSRHLEYVNVTHGDREVNCFVAYPEVKEKATAVIVIHEIFGLTDWVKGVADQLAEAGYIAIAPDLLWGQGPDGEGTEALAKSGANVGQVIRQLPPDQITADLNAIAKYVTALPASNGKVAVGGFCWGGSQSFRFATNNKDIKAAFIFYGSGPDQAADIERIAAPVYAFYGENDARVNATIPQSTDLTKAAGKTYEPVTYDGAGHGFMRAGEAPDAQEANKKAREAAWERWKELLKKL